MPLAQSSGTSDNVVPSGAELYRVGKSNKRKLSPSGRMPKNARMNNVTSAVPTRNRFTVLDNQQPGTSAQAPQAPREEKPVPMYIRGKEAIRGIHAVMTNLKIAQYDVKLLKGGLEAKLQLPNITDFRATQRDLTMRKYPFYTYQLKSERALRVFLKGLDPDTEVSAIIMELKSMKFDVKNVSNCRNKEGKKSSAFLVEINVGETNVSPHPIYALKRFMHMVVTVEEPGRSRRPVQCHNCQEFNHTRNQCHLRAVCVICAGSHKTENCDKDKENREAKKCNNCGECHTANYRGCSVYQHFYERMNPRQNRQQRIANAAQRIGIRPPVIPRSNQPALPQEWPALPEHTKLPSTSSRPKTYAKVTAGSTALPTLQQPEQSQGDLIQLLIIMQTNVSNLQNTIADLLKKQDALEGSIRAIQQSMNKLLSKND